LLRGREFIGLRPLGIENCHRYELNWGSTATADAAQKM
jgi:hypothetical protein